MNAATESTGRTVSVSGHLSMHGVAEIVEALANAPAQLPLRLDLRRARLEPQAWLALAHAVLLTRKPQLRVQGLPPHAPGPAEMAAG